MTTLLLRLLVDPLTGFVMQEDVLKPILIAFLANPKAVVLKKEQHLHSN